MKKIITAVFFSSITLFFSQQVFAQEPGAVSADSVVEQESLAKDIEAVNASYRGQLETYRRLEKEYQIALDQYQTHQTLVSIENVVAATKKAMQSRNEVLTTYLTLLRLVLLDAKGVELTQKNITLSRIEEKLLQLKEQKVFLDTMTERIQINEAHDTFVELGKSTQEVSEEALVLLAVGKLQSVYDKAFVLRGEIAGLVDPDQEVTNRAAKTRALSETDQVIESSLSGLQNSWDDINSHREKQNVYVLYRNLTKSLNPIYVNLTQTVSYFNEFLSL